MHVKLFDRPKRNGCEVGPWSFYNVNKFEIVSSTMVISFNSIRHPEAELRPVEVWSWRPCEIELESYRKVNQIEMAC